MLTQYHKSRSNRFYCWWVHWQEYLADLWHYSPIWSWKCNWISIKKIGDIKKLSNIWQLHNRIPYARTVMIKYLLLSKLTHMLMSLPSPDKQCLDYLDSIINIFYGLVSQPRSKMKLKKPKSYIKYISIIVWYKPTYKYSIWSFTLTRNKITYAHTLYELFLICSMGLASII